MKNKRPGKKFCNAHLLLHAKTNSLESVGLSIHVLHVWIQTKSFS